MITCLLCGAVALNDPQHGGPVILRHALACPDFQPERCPACRVVAVPLRGPGHIAGSGPWVLWHAADCPEALPPEVQLQYRLAEATDPGQALDPECPGCGGTVRECEMLPAWNDVVDGPLYVLADGCVDAEHVVLGDSNYGDFGGTEWIECQEWWTPDHRGPVRWANWVEWALGMVAAQQRDAERPNRALTMPELALMFQQVDEGKVREQAARLVGGDDA